MKLQYDGIIIRDAEVHDAPLLAKWWNDGEVMAHAGFPDGLGTTSEKVEKELLSHPGQRLMIEYEGDPIGEMCYEPFRPGEKALCSGYVVKGNHGAAEIGIKICVPGRREKGLGRICLSMLVKELFRLGFDEIILDTMVDNLRARHVYELIGFEMLRVNENIWTAPDGRSYSNVDSRLSPERFNDFTR